MKKGVIGAIITVVIGGMGYTISQTDVANNFANNTGMSQQQAQQYVNDTQKHLVSFSKIGQELSTDGNSSLSDASGIDCVNYTYKWETPSVRCEEGKGELQTIGNNEITTGNYYSALDTNLGDSTKSKISECINDIDSLVATYDLPIAVSLISNSQISDSKNANLYNKSVLQAALQSKK